MEPAIEPLEKTDEHDAKEELAEEENITDHLCHQPMQVNEMTQSTAGVAGYITPIWDVLAPEGGQEKAAEHIDSSRLINFFSIRQAVPDGLAQAWFCFWACCAWFFIEKKVYCSKYNTFISIILFFSSQGKEE